MDEVLRCIWCKQVIGTYEPIVIHAEGEARETSLIREQPEPIGDCYHRDCFRDAYGWAE